MARPRRSASPLLLQVLLSMLLLANLVPAAEAQALEFASPPDPDAAAYSLTTRPKADREVLLSWVAGLPFGGCLGCSDGPLFGNWTADNDICGWNAWVHTDGDGYAERGVLRCRGEEQQVKKLDLAYMNLTGPLPEAFSKLNYMADLYLQRNRMTGTLPVSWSILGIHQDSIDLDLSDNSFSGPIPSQWGANAGLKYVDLHSNELSGALPASWSALLAMEQLRMDSNNLTGTMPASWAGMRNVERLQLRENQLTGPLPPEWGLLSMLEQLNLRGNRIAGQVPPAWGLMPRLRELDLSMNALSGALPVALGNISTLTEVSLDANHFNGTLPGLAWAALTRLQRINLGDNNLTGTIPTEWSAMISLRSLTLSGNNLTGDIPASFLKFPSLSLDATETSLRLENSAPPASWSLPPRPGQQLEPQAETAPTSEPPPRTSPSTIAWIAAVAAVLAAGVLAVFVFMAVKRHRGRKYGAEDSDCCAEAGIALGIPAGSTRPDSRGISKTLSQITRAAEVPAIPKGSPMLSRQASQSYLPNQGFHEMSQSIHGLHEGMPDRYKTMPLRLLRRAYVCSAAYLPSYEEVSELGADTHLDVPYHKAIDAVWDATAVVSWRWSRPKPMPAAEPGFCPMSRLQLRQLRESLGSAHEGIQFVWVDWSCVPQYSASPMPEIARSKLYYARARTMMIIPGALPLPDGAIRVVMSNIIRALAADPSFLPQPDAELAAFSLRKLRNAQVLYGREYFGRVWTLAERMSRHSRQERLQHWMPLDIWIGMTLDAAWASSDPRCGEQDADHYMVDFYWNKLFEPEAARSSLEALRLMRETGSHMVSEGIVREVGGLFVQAVGSWRSRCVTEDVTVAWLRTYLMHEAGRVYRSWDRRDALWSIYSFFCWHVRSSEEFPQALEDLCRVAGITEPKTNLHPCLHGDCETPKAQGAEGAADAAKAGWRNAADGDDGAGEERLGEVGLSAVVDGMGTQMKD
eukprot:jgi/Tetstr1/448315/TSEL_035599.t1